MEDIKARWPALFEASNVSYKCMVIRNIPLQLWGVSYFIQNVLSDCHLINDASGIFKYGLQVTTFVFYIQDEFHWITTVHLESKFMYKLDEYSPRLLNLFHSKGGTMGLRLQTILLKVF